MSELENEVKKIETGFFPFIADHWQYIIVVVILVSAIWYHSNWKSKQIEKQNELALQINAIEEREKTAIDEKYKNNPDATQDFLDTKYKVQIELLQSQPDYRNLKSQYLKMEAENQVRSPLKPIMLWLLGGILSAFLTKIVFFVILKIKFLTTDIDSTDSSNPYLKWIAAGIIFFACFFTYTELVVLTMEKLS